MAAPAIDITQLTVRFGDLVALDGVSCRIGSGGVTALLGPNGAGKTTLTRVVATLQRPAAGTVHVFGVDVEQDPSQVQRMIGLAGQSAAVVPALTGRENLRLVGRLYGMESRAVEESLTSLVETHGLTSFLDTRISTMSGGQRRRIDLATTLIGQPRLLLLDEPTTGLDPESRRAVWKTVRNLTSGGTTILLSTQSMDEADALADDVIILASGRVLAAGPKTEVRSSVHTTELTLRTDRTLSDRDVNRLVETVGGHLAERGDRRLVVLGSFNWDDAQPALAALDAEVTQVRMEPPSLEHTLLDLTATAKQDAA